MPDIHDEEYVVVRNTSNTVVCFSGLGKDYVVQWSSPRERNGKDIQRVPRAIAQHPGFRRAVAKGILTVTDEAALDEAMRLQLELEANDKTSVEAQAQVALQPMPTDAIVIAADKLDEAGVNQVAKNQADIESLIS
jgi:hypothetical protein